MMRRMNHESVIGLVNMKPCEFTILELAQKVIEKTNSNSKIVFEDLPQDDRFNETRHYARSKH